MPKLQKADLTARQVAIEKAAMRLFIKQGFYGTSIRDIARAAGVSIGNIYNYYATKEALYLSLVRRYTAEMTKIQERIKPLLGRFDPGSLRQLAQATRDIVYNNADYWRLMYVDVTEFGNRHFAHSFRRLSKILEQRAGGYHETGLRPEVDASLAYAAIYLQFFTYFLVEKLFGGKQHLGRPEPEAIDQLIRIFREGIAAPADAEGAVQEQSHDTSEALDGLLCTGSGAGTSVADADHRLADRDR
jgi:TetR/AcrR family fatty acid metabolism transcriptional regulator